MRLVPNCNDMDHYSDHDMGATTSLIDMLCRTLTPCTQVTEVQWLLDGELFRDQGTFADGQISPYTSELSFNSQPTDDGDYSCIAVLEDSSVSPEISTSLPITVISELY